MNSLKAMASRVGLSAVLAITCFPFSTFAAPFSLDQCAVIIASRPTLAEAHAWALSSPYPVDIIYESSNGYYAVSAGLIPKANWRAQVADYKQAGLVPNDAYCSGKGIVAVAANNPQEAEEKIRAEQESRALAAANAARLEAERNAARAAAAAAAAEERARSAEMAAAAIISDREQSSQADQGAVAQAASGAAAEATPKDDSDYSISSGTGFRISPDLIVTNNHVVQECSSILVDGQPANALERSSTFDLAVLSTQNGERAPTWLPLSNDPPRLNSDVIVAGYPLYGLLGGINVTRGTISSLRGLGGDDSSMQISAPIQNGNSGGPVVDRFGRVVGVVVAKINNDALKEVVGLTAENVNFAVRGDILQLMLDRYGVPYDSREAEGQLSPEDLADHVTAATALVECH